MIELRDESDADAELGQLEELSRFVLARMRVHPEAELSITAVDEQRMAELNGLWMGATGPTDVLAFPIDELRPAEEGEEPRPGTLGDLVLCPEVARRQGVEAGHGTRAELELLTVHGVLHLLGYDHAEPAEHAEMFALQADLLGQWRGEDQGGVPAAGGLEHEQR